jgi:hypothetical protein
MTLDPIPPGARAYAELRVLTEELHDASTPDAEAYVMAAIAIWLRAHCARCGDVIPHDSRSQLILSPICDRCEPPMG